MSTHYFGCDFSDCCRHCCLSKHDVSAAVYPGLRQVSPVYLGIEMIQTFKAFKKYDQQSNFKNDVPGWTPNNKDEDSSPKNHSSNNARQYSSKTIQTDIFHIYTVSSTPACYSYLYEAQSAGAVEYADCISAEGKTPHTKKKSVLLMKQNLSKG